MEEWYDEEYDQEHDEMEPLCTMPTALISLALLVALVGLLTIGCRLLVK